MIIRAILPKWHSRYPLVVEEDMDAARIEELNNDGFNIYFLPNYPSTFDPTTPVDGRNIDRFESVFVDMDLKEKVYESKEAFLAVLLDFPLRPSMIVDSGGGIHAYWNVSDLNVKSFLRLQRRLCRHLVTDEAVAKIYQLMRVPQTYNTKIEGNPRLCEVLELTNNVYTCEQVDAVLPAITSEDEAYCEAHFNKTYGLNEKVSVDERLPIKFAELIRNNGEVKDIWAGASGTDRSTSDYRLGHIMFAHGFTKDEAMSVLVNAAKALTRAPTHRIGYAQSIVDKIWTFEQATDKNSLTLSSSVRQILARSGDNIKGTRFPCWSYLDATEHGFRLGQVIGLVAGSGVGKTAMSLNMFMGFVQNNPDYDHFFVPLEQPANEIADRWYQMCGPNSPLHDKVHVISNYADDGAFRHLSFTDIKDYILAFQKKSGRKIGCVVIDHIGALKKKGANGENQDLMDICHSMKAFAIETNTMLVMQSQAPREKAGIGDLELNKDAAYGTVYFESYCDYLVTIWQPLKRCYAEDGCPTVTAFKFCKIRHKKRHLDKIQEDVRYLLYFDPEKEALKEMTQDQETSFKFFNIKATRERSKDRKTDQIEYTTITWTR